VVERIQHNKLAFQTKSMLDEEGDPVERKIKVTEPGRNDDNNDGPEPPEEAANPETAPEATSTPVPTNEATPEPTEEPTAGPTEAAPAEPTDEGAPEPTEEATPEPTAGPTEAAPAEPTEEATPEPTEEPVQDPTPEPTSEPSPETSPEPSTEPSVESTPEPGGEPAHEPAPEPTAEPTQEPAASPSPTPALHIGDLDGTSTADKGQKWRATVSMVVFDATGTAAAGATVSAVWSNDEANTVSCTTDGNGQCSVSSDLLGGKTTSVTLAVNGLSHSTFTYQPSDNSDPDGDSDGTSITVNEPA
jgi:hypothetical protein